MLFEICTGRNPVFKVVFLLLCDIFYSFQVENRNRKQEVNVLHTYKQGHDLYSSECVHVCLNYLVYMHQLVNIVCVQMKDLQLL